MKVRLCLQMFNGIVIAGIAETLALVERCGVNITDFSDILELNGSNCQLVKNTTRGTSMKFLLSNLKSRNTVCF